MKNNHHAAKLVCKRKELVKRSHSEYFRFEDRLTDKLVKEIYFNKRISKKTKVNGCQACTDWTVRRARNKRAKSDRKLLKEIFDLNSY